MASSIRYTQSYPPTLTPSDAPPFIAPKPRRTGLIIGIIIAVVVVIIIIVVVVVLVLRSRKKPPVAGGGSGGGGSGGTPSGITCTTNAQCTAPKVCNESMKRCVDCMSNTQCEGGTFPFCRAETNTCVKCLVTPDCGGVANTTCSGNICCNSTPPVINSITSTVSNDTRVQLNLEIKQPLGSSKVFVVLEDLNGNPILNKQCINVKLGGTTIACGATGPACPTGDICTDGKCAVPSCMIFAAEAFVLLISSSMQFKFFTELTYRVRVKVVYDCGALRNASTEFSAPRNFTIGSCPGSRQASLRTYTEVVVVRINGTLTPKLIIGLASPNEISRGVPAPNFLVGFIGSKTPGLHPNRMEIAVPPVLTRNGPDGFKLVILPFPGVATFYVRAYNAGGPENCDGPLGAEFRFFTDPPDRFTREIPAD